MSSAGPLSAEPPSPDAPQAADSRDETLRRQQDRILEAAAEEFRAAGVRHANVERIAEHAGVSRSTLYRRFPSKDDLLGAVVTRFRRQFVRELSEKLLGLDPRATVVEAFCLAMSHFNHDELLKRVLGDTPEAVDVLVGFSAPQVKDMVDEFSRGIVSTLRAAGACMPEHQLRLAAEIQVRMVTSLITAPSHVLAIDDEKALREFAETMLAPMIW
ncbi:TetR/AcrR family transcriptional regulator [Gordonia zhaorongruii]|uniref:TetR/AcrR family transcriptional regulator n=1 Tax=Gordonia zhaorongruii TaxID=2597659 RepID=UPI001F2348E4|nr:TetR/AcrR family transcriptional regulator [Gordonia zhaorongruii]